MYKLTPFSLKSRRPALGAAEHVPEGNKLRNTSRQRTTIP
jgi:hypothetical protein